MHQEIAYHAREEWVESQWSGLAEGYWCQGQSVSLSPVGAAVGRHMSAIAPHPAAADATLDVGPVLVDIEVRTDYAGSVAGIAAAVVGYEAGIANGSCCCCVAVVRQSCGRAVEGAKGLE